MALARETAGNVSTERRALPVLARLTLQWQRVGLALVLAVAAALEFIGLDSEGYANTYYAAGVKSMLTNWHNFFYVSYDGGGFVSIDKPPLGLWIEAASAKLFGFSGFSLLFPEALAGVLSVGLLYHLIARTYGPAAGLLAALALAVTPISVVTDRNNTIDSLLILTLLLGAWAALRAAESGRLRLLLLCALLVGLGFNIKMLQAYLVVPAFGLVYLFGAPISWRRRIGHLVLATIVLLVVSLSWAVIVDLTPVSQRPFVSDSGTNSELSLALGYNGLGRLTQALFSGLTGLKIFGITIDMDVVPAFAPEIGDPSPWRLLGPTLGSQVSWLVPLALAGLLAAGRELRLRLPLDRRGQALLLWGGWLLATGGFFSVARFYHLYYLVMLAPAIAALAGIGITALWRAYREPTGWWGWLLPVALLATAVLQMHLLSAQQDWNSWIGPLLIACCVLVAVILAVGRLRLRILVAPEQLLQVTPLAALATTVVGVLALLGAPTAWAAVSAANGNGGAWLPQAGPASSSFGGGAGFQGGGRQGGRFSGGGAARNGFGGNNGARGFGGGAGQAPTGSGSGTAPFGQGGAGPQGAGTPGSGATGSGQQGAGAAGALRQRFGQGQRGFGGGGGGAMTFAGNQVPQLDAKLLQYLEANQGSARFLVATTTSSYASLFILQTDQPAMALGGYQGWDRILTPATLASQVAKGTVRFFYIPAASPFSAFQQPQPAGTGSATSSDIANVNNDLTQWVQNTCTAVPMQEWQSTSSGQSVAGGQPGAFRSGGQQLYDCASKGGS